MKRYSYTIGVLSKGWKPEDEQAHLNEAGQRGWELVSVICKVMDGIDCTFYYFRKEKTESADDTALAFPLEAHGKG
jgi:hypothetical protein